MIISINLKDPRYCEGCPALHGDTEEPTQCSLGQWGEYDLGEYINSRDSPDGEWHYVRPQRCRDEYGD